MSLLVVELGLATVCKTPQGRCIQSCFKTGWLEKASVSEQSTGKPMSILEGSGESDSKMGGTEPGGCQEMDLAPSLLLIGCVIFGKLLTLSGP